MKVNPRVKPEDIDKLLNSFLDGELPVRQLAEVQRLLAGNSKLARRLDQLRRCRALLRAVPYAQAPKGILENVKASVAESVALAQKAPVVHDGRGGKQLMLRKMLTAAAMFALVAVLAGVIYTIVSPHSPGSSPGPARMATTRPGQGTTVEPAGVVADIRARLALATDSFVDAGAAINMAIKDADLEDFVTIDQLPQETLYTITCPRDRLEGMLTRLEQDWPVFRSATLVLQADSPADCVGVEGVTLEQVAGIFAEDRPDRRARAAKYFAIANGASDVPVDDSQAPDAVTIPRPVLTDDRPIEGPDSQQPDGETVVSLTLALTAQQ